MTLSTLTVRYASPEEMLSLFPEYDHWSRTEFGSLESQRAWEALVTVGPDSYVDCLALADMEIETGSPDSEEWRRLRDVAERERQIRER